MFKYTRKKHKSLDTFESFHVIMKHERQRGCVDKCSVINLYTD